MAKVVGIEGMTTAEVDLELQRGGRFVVYLYTISLVVVTLRRGSNIYFIRSGENPLMKGLPYTLLSLVAGWWGVPWGRSGLSSHWSRTCAAGRT